MKIQIETKNLKLDINLFDNKFNDEMIKKFDNARDFTLSRITKPKPFLSLDNTSKVWNNLRNSYYNFISTIQTEKILDIPIEFDKTNYWLNVLHRVFTTAFQHKTYMGDPIILTNDGMRYINDINDFCHILETMITNQTIKSWAKKPITYFEFSCSNLNKTTIINCEPYLNIVSQDADAYVLKHITGKDFLTAYFDDDTSNSWDVNNGHVTYVGFTLDPLGDFKRAWNDPDFINWINQYGYTGKIGFIPIGNLSDADKEKLIKFSKDTKNLYKTPFTAKIEN